MAALKSSLISLLFYLCSVATVDAEEYCPLRDCFEIKQKAISERKCTFNGVYTVRPQHDRPAFKVYCDMETDGGGWTVFQRRMDGSVDFYRKWRDYKYGFGSLEGEFWLGLDKISRLTEVKSCLHVDLEDFEGNKRYANYSTFSVGGAIGLYKLTVGGYSGNAGDGLTQHNGMKFTTIDRDNDIATFNCALQFSGAWWYTACHASNLNGLYLRGETKTYADGVNWWAFRRTHYYSLKFTEMKMRLC